MGWNVLGVKRPLSDTSTFPPSSYLSFSFFCSLSFFLSFSPHFLSVCHDCLPLRVSLPLHLTLSHLLSLSVFLLLIHTLFENSHVCKRDSYRKCSLAQKSGSIRPKKNPPTTKLHRAKRAARYSLTGAVLISKKSSSLRCRSNASRMRKRASAAAATRARGID